MAKAIRSFYGTDTYGRHVETALSESGQWFWREYGWNGYGNVWSRWAALDEVIFVKTDSKCGQWPTRMEWGFNYLDETTPFPGEKPLRYRLPF